MVAGYRGLSFVLLLGVVVLVVVACSESPSEPDRTNWRDVHNPDRDQTPPSVNGVVPTPGSGAGNVSNPVTLSWTEASDGLSGVSGYRVYLDTVNPPGPSSEIHAGSELSCSAGLLGWEETYYWRLLAVDGAGNESMSDVWTFVTAAPVDDFILVNADTFTMGSPVGELGRQEGVWESQHEVTLSSDFWLSPYEVTEELWDLVMGSGSSTSQLPCGGVSWNSVIQFCNALSELRGLTPASSCRGSGHVTWDPNADGYRLPTEAEWEYACRAGSQAAFSNGGITDEDCDDPTLDQIGWYCGNSWYNKQPVGQLLPNAWGLFDMHGNVWEWCWDVYQGGLGTSPVIDPVIGGYAQDTVTARVLRGGGWNYSARACRSAARNFDSPSIPDIYFGFRLARSAF